MERTPTETARRKDEVDRVSRPSGQRAGGRASSGFRGPVRNQPGGKRARGPDPLRRVNNSSRPRVDKPGRPSKPRATDNAESKLLDMLGDTIKVIATTSNVGGSQDPRARNLVHERSLPSRTPSPETVVDNPRGNRAASPAASQYDLVGDRRVPGWLASQYDDPATFRRPASPSGAHDLRGGRGAPSLTRSRFDDPGRRDPSPARSRYNDLGRRSASPTGSRFDDPGHRSPRASGSLEPRGSRRAPSPTRSRFDDPGYRAPRASEPRGGRRPPSPTGSRFDDTRGGRVAASPQRSKLDSRRGNHRAASPQHSRFDNRDNRGNRRAPSSQDFRHDDLRGGGSGSRDNTRSQSNRRRSSPHGRILDVRANRAASPQASRLDLRGNNRAPSPQNSRYGSPRGGGRSRDVTRSDSHRRRPSPHSAVLDDPRRTVSEDCQNCKQPGHHHTRCPQNQRTTAPTHAVAQIEQSFDTRVNHLPVPANRRTRPEGVFQLHDSKP